jgi:hypothetical protein
MPRYWFLPRWRLVVMQSVMWVILVTTIGLAALLDHQLRQSLYVALGSPVVEGPLSAAFPEGWKISSRHGDGDAVLHVAVEPGNPGGRTLIISRQRVSRLMSPFEYLYLSGQLEGNLQVGGPQPCTIDGWPGQSLLWTTGRSSVRNLMLNDKSIGFANAAYCVILPTREAITIRLQRQGNYDASDARLIKQIVGSVRISDGDKLSSSPISFSDGTSVSAPPGFAIYPQPDPLRTDRTMTTETAEGNWISAQFIPTLLAPGETATTIREMVAASQHLDQRDPPETVQWLRADVIEEEAGRWMIEPKELSNARVRRRAYVISGPGHRGMLMILTCVIEQRDEDMDALWAAFSDQIHFGPATVDARPMLRVGAAAASSPGSPTDGEKWWIWSRDGQPIGWTDEKIDVNNLSDPGSIRVTRDKQQRNWDGTYTHIVQEWGWAGQQAPWARVEREDAEPDPTGRFVRLFRERMENTDAIRTVIDGGGIAMELTPNSPAFVFAGRLPALLSSVSKEPVAIWTDRFPGIETELLTSPVLLLVRRVDGAAKDLQCVEVEINGTGQLSRWYFNADGSLNHADLADGVMVQPGTEAQVESAFAGEPRLTVRPR